MNNHAPLIRATHVKFPNPLIQSAFLYYWHFHLRLSDPASSNRHQRDPAQVSDCLYLQSVRVFYPQRLKSVSISVVLFLEPSTCDLYFFALTWDNVRLFQLVDILSRFLARQQTSSTVPIMIYRTVVTLES